MRDAGSRVRFQNSLPSFRCLRLPVASETRRAGTALRIRAPLNKAGGYRRLASSEFVFAVEFARRPVRVRLRRLSTVAGPFV